MTTLVVSHALDCARSPSDEGVEANEVKVELTNSSWSKPFPSAPLRSSSPSAHLAQPLLLSLIDVRPHSTIRRQQAW